MPSRAEARITMWGLGGLTHGTNVGHLTPQQRIVVSAAGSTVEMLVLGGPAWLLQMIWSPGGWAGLTLHWLVWINVIWALINLAPVWPMDGGHILDELLYLRAKGSRRQLTHRISIVTGVIASVFAMTQGLSWAAILFLLFVVINLFAAGIVRTKTNVGLWPGVTTAQGAVNADLHRHTKATTNDMMGSGYSSLRAGSSSFAQAEADRVLAKSKSRTKRQAASEMQVWAAIVSGDSARALAEYNELAKPSKCLSAVIQIEQGQDQLGITAVSAAIQAEAKLPVSEQAILYAARTGHIGHVVDELLTQGTVGLGHAVRVQYILDTASMTEASEVVSARL